MESILPILKALQPACTISDILSALDNYRELSKSQKTEILFRLINIGALQIAEDNPSFEYSRVYVNLAAVPPDEIVFKFHKRRLDVSELEIVASFPPEIYQSGNVPEGITNLADAFSSIIISAKKTLRIASPFIDQGGVRILEDALLQSRKGGVQLWLLTRMNSPEQDRLQYFAIKQLREIFQEALTVRSYCHKEECAVYDRVLEGLHTKAIIADDEVAYIGSGEVRLNSLTQLFELGAVIKGEGAQQAGAAFNAAWDRATPV